MSDVEYFMGLGLNREEAETMVPLYQKLRDTSPAREPATRSIEDLQDKFKKLNRYLEFNYPSLPVVLFLLYDELRENLGLERLGPTIIRN